MYHITVCHQIVSQNFQSIFKHTMQKKIPESKVQVGLRGDNLKRLQRTLGGIIHTFCTPMPHINSLRTNLIILLNNIFNLVFVAKYLILYIWPPVLKPTLCLPKLVLTLQHRQTHTQNKRWKKKLVQIYKRYNWYLYFNIHRHTQ